MAYVYKTMESPVGQLTLVGRGEKLAAILWENDKPTRVKLGELTPESGTGTAVLLETERQLNEYFAGKRQRFEVELDFTGTDFQKRVWAALLTIPFGETRSYGDIARQLGDIKAVRAVGAANGKNPISIIAPCHRVIGASGELTGFAGGLKAKELLLTLEGAHALHNKPGTGVPQKRRSKQPDPNQGMLFSEGL
ncbi:methylated-DNA--[protein]-cysteine S-methyltransferase [Herbaspirillum rhizosphaerae]|uniref:methylated-DNA--[protein]-cysteine S-methyltransferase n=1 Tax=Herbaspirillum rhizosphaerae TaxID=346179 RepID=UPI00067D9E85|nr:methylated-DNA--[protein]-cysteine S-methyltransferase [Herbaspirillum rhizosphaerae]